MENLTTTTVGSSVGSPLTFFPVTAAFTIITHQLRNLLMHGHRHFDSLNGSLHFIYNQTQMLTKEVSDLAKEVEMEDASLVHLAHYSFQSISHLVTNLQYQDLIRQKLEHNQQVNEKVLTWMQEIAITPSTSSLEDRLGLLPSLIRLQSIQLDYADSEYQKAFRRMSISLDEFGENTKDVGDLAYTIIEHLVDADNEALQNKANTIRTLVQQIKLEVVSLLSETSEAYLFTETINTIKSQWQKLSSQLAIPILPYSSSDLALLEQLEELYTMESERHIFRQTFFPKSVTGKLVTNEGEVELF